MPSFSPLITQIWVVTTILISMVGHGMVIGITSSMLPALQAADSLIKVNLEQASWLSASVGVGNLTMFVISSYIWATYGRRRATFIGLIPAVIGHLLCYFFSDINILILGRFISGMSIGAGLMGAIVIGEFTSPQYRGVFLNFKSGALYFGSTIVHILGNYFHWRTVTLIVIFVYLVPFVMTFTWPESPAWLATQKKYNECTKCFYLLRGKSEQSTRELLALIAAQKEQPYEVERSFYKDVVKFLKKFTKYNFLKPVCVYLFLAILLEVSGRHTFSAYALSILHQMNPDPSYSFYYILGLDLMMSTSAVISTVLVKMVKRRTLLFYSGVPSVIVLLGVCLYYFLQSLGLISKTYDTVSIILFGLFFGVVNLGCTPICLTLVGEMFPLEHRPTAVSLSGVMIAIFMILTLKITPIMLETIKMYGTFAVYGISMAACLLILYFILPETKDKTLQEIEDYFSNERKPNEQTRDKEHANLIVVNGLQKVPRSLSELYLEVAS